MRHPAELSPDARRHFYRRVALAPLCLCLVAGLHVVRVWTCRQTPWKGGGFGMFSTIDDESARFFRCYLVTDDADFPLAIPPAAEKATAELRAAPSQAKLDELARRFAAQSWRWRDEREAREVAAIRQQAGRSISAAVLKPSATGLTWHPMPAVHECRMLEPVPRGEAAAGAVPFRAVRIECHRYRYAAASRTLETELLLAATAPTTGLSSPGVASGVMAGRVEATR